jgi:maltose-binding protein MalE
MATIYKVEIVSFWTNYTKEQLEKILQDAVNKIEKEKGNEIQITVQDRS